MSNNTNTSIDEQHNITVQSPIDDYSRTLRIVFLALFIIVSLVGNLCMIIVIVQNKKYRGMVLNLIILNQTVVNLFDCIFNMPLVFGSLVATEWVYGDLMCQFNTFCMNIVIVETVLTLMTLTVDRFIAVKIAPSRYGNILSPSRTYIALGYTWFHSLSFSLPLLAGAVPSTFQNQIHLCSISDSSSLIFICLTSIVCFLAPVVAIFVLFILIFKAAYSERFSECSKLAEHSYSEKNIAAPQIWREIDMAKYAVLLSLLWVVLEVPYIVTAYIKQYQYSREFQMNPDIGKLDYPWAVDVTFVWVRFAFSGILPILTFTWKREFWRSWKDTVLCRRSNSVTNFESAANRRIGKNMKNNNGNIPSVKSRVTDNVGSNHTLAFNVPVLFATANGIHVQTDEGNLADSDIFYAEITPTDRSATDLRFLKGKKLDVVSALEYLPPDTSDYDSNSEDEVTDEVTDRYSLSQPISTRQLENNDIEKVSRSSSQPDVQEKRPCSQTSTASPFKAKLTAFPYETDSGLDLSGTSRCRETLTGRNKLAEDNIFGTRTIQETEFQTYVLSERRTNVGETKSSANDSQDLINFVPDTSNVDTSTNSAEKTVTTMAKDSQQNDTHLFLTQTVTVKKKPPLHLEPLTSKNASKSELKPSKKKKTKTVNSTTSLNSVDSDKGAFETGELSKEHLHTKHSSKKSSKPGHKRQGTSDSQKALLGSSSSAELNEMKVELERMEAVSANHTVSGPTPEHLPHAQQD